jgi:hypothetical protein
MRHHPQLVGNRTAAISVGFELRAEPGYIRDERTDDLYSRRFSHHCLLSNADLERRLVASGDPSYVEPIIETRSLSRDWGPPTYRSPHNPGLHIMHIMRSSS